MKRFIGVCIIIIALVAGGVYVYPAVFPKKYNLIIVSFDGLQAKHLHEYGYPLSTTPNLDKFLDSSYLFTKAVSPAPWTVPAHMSIFTSMYPSEHKVLNKFSDFNTQTGKGVIANLKALSPNAVTLADILKKNGYVTGGFTGDSGVGAQFGFKQGFDTYFDGPVFGGFDVSIPKALEWLETNRNKPFFLFLHGYDVHGQHAPAAGFDYRYVAKPYTGSYTGSTAEQGKLREEGLQNGKLAMSERDVQFWRAIYDEKINRADSEFQGFLTRIRDMGLMENTVIILISDHGTEFYEHQRFDHGFTLYSELLNVLFAVHIPGQTQGKHIAQLVSTMDILPTALALLGIRDPVPNQVKGSDITGAFSGHEVGHDVYSETDYRLYTFKRSIETPDGWKFILTLENGNKELFNLNDDPDEQTNLAGKIPQKAYALEVALRKHIDGIAGQRTADQIGCSPVYTGQCQ